MSNPSVPDLLKDSSDPLGTDNEYFLVTILDLDVGTTYPIQFRWKYKDATPSEDWSAVYNVITQISTVPNTPQLQSSDVVGDAGFIKVTWSGNDSSGNPITNIDRVDVHISGSSFGDGTTPSGNFKKAGTLTFAATPGVYIVQLKAYRLNGTSSFFSTTRTVTVTSPGEVIQTPTLPSGLTVATAPFAVTINWPGTYSVGTFTGFKSIDIYAVGSDLGSTATSGITSTNLVGSLTVNDTPNKINISLDNLRQALSLSTNSDVYSATIFYYYNATNKDGTKYGSPTYTRINSSSVIPTKANFVDLVSGVISIENLVAGNGSFSSWLRTGSAGGARIELSAVTDFSNGGNTVQKGLVAYSSGNTEIFNLDIDAGTLTINGSGTFSGSLSAASGTFTGALNIGTISGGLYPFSVSSSGVLRAISGTIGGLTLSASSLGNSGNTFALDSGGKARFGSSTGSAIIIDPAAAVGSAYIYHSSNGGTTASGSFTVSSGGILTATGGNFSGTITNGSDYWNSNGTFRFGGSTGINYNGSSITLGSSGNPITINTSTGVLSIAGTLAAGSIVLSNGDYWNVGSGFQLGGESGVRFAGSTIFLGSTGNPVTINTSTGNVAIGGNLAAASVTINASTDYWTGANGFRLGGSTGINYSGSGTIGIGSNVAITGNISSTGTISGGTLSGPTITGSTITGGLLRTASTGARIEISGSDQGTNPNSIVFMNPSGAPTSHIVPMNIGGTQYGLLMHYGGTADSSGGSYPQIFIGSSNVSISSRSGGVGTQSATLGVDYTGISLNTSPTSGFSNAANISFNPGAGGQVTFGTSTGLTMEYLASNGNLRIGGNITRLQADGQIFANTLGTSAGTTLVQSSSGFIKVLSSSRRYKENIVEINKSGYLNLISLLKPVTFNYKQDVSPDDYQVTLAGLIAEDVQEIENLRTLVNYNLNGEPESISYNALSALLVLAIKEIKDKIESIEQRLDALEG